MSNRVIWVMLLASLSLRGFCQGYVNYDYLPSSSFKDKEGNRHGSGDLQRISGRYTIPLSRKLNERNQPTAWGLTLSASYGMMDNEGEARELNPDRVLNTKQFSSRGNRAGQSSCFSSCPPSYFRCVSVRSESLQTKAVFRGGPVSLILSATCLHSC